MSLMDFLVTSKTRQELLRVLVAEDVSASAHQLAKLVDGSYSLVHGELRAMEKEGLVTCQRKGKAHVFQLNNDYGELKSLKALLRPQKKAGSQRAEVDDESLKLNLSRYGAPLGVHGRSDLELPLEQTLVFGLALARRDATVARALPVVFQKQAGRLDLRKLEYLARELKVLPVLGFYLDLTGALSNTKALRLAARKLRDRRRKRPEPFFLAQRANPFEERLAQENTPAVARAWNFRMNMPLDSFETLFRKHTEMFGAG